MVRARVRSKQKQLDQYGRVLVLFAYVLTAPCSILLFPPFLLSTAVFSCCLAMLWLILLRSFLCFPALLCTALSCCLALFWSVSSFTVLHYRVLLPCIVLSDPLICFPFQLPIFLSSCIVLVYPILCCLSLSCCPLACPIPLRKALHSSTWSSERRCL